MNFSTLCLFGLFAAVSCGPEPASTNHLLTSYIEAANAHDFPKLNGMIADRVVWILGLDTLSGRNEVMEPLFFDEGAQTTLEARNVSIKGDTAEFELTEKNDVLTGLGIDSLIHFPRFVFSDGLVVLKEPRQPPVPFSAFQDSVLSFLGWLRMKDSTAYGRFFDANGNFHYSSENGRVMSELTREWANRGSGLTSQ